MITAYGMRHGFASNFLIASISDAKVARWLGHADTRIVHLHYGHPSTTTSSPSRSLKIYIDCILKFKNMVEDQCVRYIIKECSIRTLVYYVYDNIS